MLITMEHISIYSWLTFQVFKTFQVYPTDQPRQTHNSRYIPFCDKYLLTNRVPYIYLSFNVYQMKSMNMKVKNPIMPEEEQDGTF
jgi:hypothetical protein